MKLFAFLAALCLAGCAAFIAKPPSVTLAGVDLESIGLFEQRYVLQLRVTNPNDVDIPVSGLSFDLELNGVHFATGVSSQSVTIPRLGDALLAVSTTSNLGSFLRQWRELQKGGREGIAYRIKGSLRVPGRGALPFDHRGEVALPELPGMEKPAPKTLPGSV